MPESFQNILAHNYEIFQIVVIYELYLQVIEKQQIKLTQMKNKEAQQTETFNQAIQNNLNNYQIALIIQQFIQLTNNDIKIPENWIKYTLTQQISFFLSNIQQNPLFLQSCNQYVDKNIDFDVLELLHKSLKEGKFNPSDNNKSIIQKAITILYLKLTMIINNNRELRSFYKLDENLYFKEYEIALQQICNSYANGSIKFQENKLDNIQANNQENTQQQLFLLSKDQIEIFECSNKYDINSFENHDFQYNTFDSFNFQHDFIQIDGLPRQNEEQIDQVQKEQIRDRKIYDEKDAEDIRNCDNLNISIQATIIDEIHNLNLEMKFIEKIQHDITIFHKNNINRNKIIQTIEKNLQNQPWIIILEKLFLKIQFQLQEQIIQDFLQKVVSNFISTVNLENYSALLTCLKQQIFLEIYSKPKYQFLEFSEKQNLENILFINK